MALADHVKKYAKAYSGGGTALIAQPFSDHAANILMWALSFVVVPPESVQLSFRYVFVALVTGAITALVGNRE